MTAITKYLTDLKVFGGKFHGQSGVKADQGQQNIIHCLYKYLQESIIFVLKVLIIKCCN